MRASFSVSKTYMQKKTITSILGMRSSSSGRPTHVLLSANDLPKQSTLPKLAPVSNSALKQTTTSSFALRSYNCKEIDENFAKKIMELEPNLKCISEFASTLQSRAIFLYAEESTTLYLLNLISQVLFKPLPDLTIEEQYGDFPLTIIDQNFSYVKSVHELLVIILTHGQKDTNVKWLQSDGILHKICDCLLYPDPREAQIGEQLIFNIYKNYPSFHSKLMYAIINILGCFINGYHSYHGISTVIEFIEYYIRAKIKLWAPSDTVMVKKYLVPLLNNQFVYKYYPALNQILSFVYSKDPSLGKSNLKYILRYWPKTNSKKAACYINHLLTITNIVGSKYIKRSVPEMFMRLNEALKGESTRVIGEATKVISDINFLFEFMGRYPKKVKMLFNAVEANTTHWSLEVSEISKKAVYFITNSMPNILGIGIDIKETPDTYNIWKNISNATGVDIVGSL